MSITTDEVDAQPPYRSVDELLSANIYPSKSAAVLRLFWSFDSPFPKAISVMENGHTPNSLTPYFSDGVFHPIAQESVSIHKISSVTVSVLELDDWERSWDECHDQHDDCGPERRWFGKLDNVNYDEVLEDDPDYPGALLQCCGEPRPMGKEAKLVVKPVTGDFVTIHDYLSAVHSWLMEMTSLIGSSGGHHQTIRL